MGPIALMDYKCNIIYKQYQLSNNNQTDQSDIMLDHIIFILTINYLHVKYVLQAQGL